MAEHTLTWTVFSPLIGVLVILLLPSGRERLMKTVALEMLTSIKRAGAHLILTYWARDVARWLASGQ